MKKLYGIILCIIILQGESLRQRQNDIYNVFDDTMYFLDTTPPPFQQYSAHRVQKQFQAQPIIGDDDESDVQSADINVYDSVIKNTQISQRPSILSVSQYPSSTVPVKKLFNASPSSATIQSQGSVRDDEDRSGSSNGQSFNVSAAIGNFGISMMKNLRKTDSTNLVMSPYSVVTLLALLEQGAQGETLQQISRALGMPPDLAANSFKRISEDIQARDASNNILKVANSVFASDHIKINSYFESKARYNFGSDVFSVNFGDSRKATQSINNWVSNKTNRNIQQLLSPDAVNTNTQLVMVNAMYFKGIWQSKFAADATLPRDFFVTPDLRKTIPFMRARRYYRCGVDSINKAEVVILPFEKQEYSMIMLLPSKKSSVNGLLSSLSYEQLAGYHSFSPIDIELEIPKFNVRTDTDLQPLLETMGITKIFGGQSELFGVGDNSNGSPQISSALHTALLSIDENGSTAAAATSFSVVALSYNGPSAIFKANRPFLVVLWDTKLSAPLFMAKINDPTLM